MSVPFLGWNIYCEASAAMPLHAASTGSSEVLYITCPMQYAYLTVSYVICQLVWLHRCLPILFLLVISVRVVLQRICQCCEACAERWWRLQHLLRRLRHLQRFWCVVCIVVAIAICSPCHCHSWIGLVLLLLTIGKMLARPSCSVSRLCLWKQPQPRSEGTLCRNNSHNM